MQYVDHVLYEDDALEFFKANSYIVKELIGGSDLGISWRDNLLIKKEQRYYVCFEGSGGDLALAKGMKIDKISLYTVKNNDMAGELIAEYDIVNEKKDLRELERLW